MTDVRERREGNKKSPPRSGTGREELYAYRTDRMELRNLAEGDSAAERLTLWRERLARVLRDVRVVPPNGKR